MLERLSQQDQPVHAYWRCSSVGIAADAAAASVGPLHRNKHFNMAVSIGEWSLVVSI